MAETPYRHVPADLPLHPRFLRLTSDGKIVHLLCRPLQDLHGRFEADAFKLWRVYLPDMTEERVQAALEDNAAFGWMGLYIHDGIQWAWFLDADSMHSETFLKRDRPRSTRPAPPGYVDPRDTPAAPRGPSGDHPGKSRGRSGDAPGSHPDTPGNPLSRGARSKKQEEQDPTTTSRAGAYEGAREADPADPSQPPGAGEDLLAIAAPARLPDVSPPLHLAPPPDPEEPVPRDARFDPLRAFAERWRPESHYPETPDQVVAFAVRVERERGHPLNWALVVERANGRAGPRGKKVENASAMLLRWVDTESKAREFEPGREENRDGQDTRQSAQRSRGAGKERLGANGNVDFPTDWGTALDTLPAG